MAWSPFAGKRPSPSHAALSSQQAMITVTWDETGVSFHPSPAPAGWLDAPSSFGSDADLVLLLRQLDDEAYVEIDEERALLEWESYYKLRSLEEYSGSLDLLGLPPYENWRPALTSKGALIDPDFSIAIQSWRDSQGNMPRGNPEILGAVLTSSGKSSLLPEPVWRTVRALAERRAKVEYDQSSDENRRDWARIRAFAVEAKADLADFLKKTVVLTPDRLRMEMRKADVGGERLVEIRPSFEGAPERWMETFDRFSNVPERYDIPDGAGLVQVILSEDVRTVLKEIRRIPGRRVVGERAEAFVRNPFATLGPAAENVIDPEQFERARADAGIVFSRFTARILHDEYGFPFDVGLIVQEVFEGLVSAEAVKFETARDLGKFLAKLDERIASGAQCCHWQGYDLEILGDTPTQAENLHKAMHRMSEPRRVKALDIYDLSKYSDRIGGFGVEPPYYSPFIAKKSGEAGWFPDNVDLGLCFTPEGGETVAIVLDDQNLEDFRREANRVREENGPSFSFAGCPKPVPVDWAIEALDTLDAVKQEVGGGSFEPKQHKDGKRAVERKGLVVKSNIDTLEYEEVRGDLRADRLPPKLPTSLRGDVSLKNHQLEGVAWLQHMWRSSPKSCRGALLADDMGLGKTIQLLAFMAEAIEADPKLDPFLVVAPVSLLDNWKGEIEKFFEPGSMDVLTLYGSALASKRLPKSALDETLLEAGSPKLLKHGWLGDARVVLTTYETLRDLEFSLAAQRWSAMICDEAQKIKNDNAMVTRAAKKQNARLKIACTGTPVENTLADIWCLFDFMQPGLLGVLKDFGTKYRKPIEAGTDEEKARIEELRELIDPQILRRIKADVAKDLPDKIVDGDSKGYTELKLSPRQRVLYADAVAQFRSRLPGQSTGLQSPLGLLQYLRRLCSDPRPPGHVSTSDESLDEVKRASPKMSWMLSKLSDIRKLGEKVIVFCEFRDLQRTLQRPSRIPLDSYRISSTGTPRRTQPMRITGSAG